MNVQIEVTTRCNFACFYCTGRDMPQQDMSFDLFKNILDRHVSSYGKPSEVSLQGEGEPTLNKNLFHMAAYLQERQIVPYTVTNGSFHHPEKFLGWPRIGISVDTMSEEAATKIGRYNLPRVLKFATDVSKFTQVQVLSVHGEGTKLVAEWAKENKFQHFIQALQVKQDYSYLYPQLVKQVPQPEKFSCSYLKHPIMRYYDINGQEMPCCYIKSGFEGMAKMKEHQLKGTWSPPCIGCTKR